MRERLLKYAGMFTYSAGNVAKDSIKRAVPIYLGSSAAAFPFIVALNKGVTPLGALKHAFKPSKWDAFQGAVTTAGAHLTELERVRRNRLRAGLVGALGGGVGLATYAHGTEKKSR